MADADNGQPLAVGQRLVTRDGVMRRWDGFVSIGGGAAAAERLLRANRLAEIDRQLPALEQRSRDGRGGARRSRGGGRAASQGGRSARGPPPPTAERAGARRDAGG